MHDIVFVILTTTIEHAVNAFLVIWDAILKGDVAIIDTTIDQEQFDILGIILP